MSAKFKAAGAAVMATQSAGECVKVVVRCRPMNKTEIKDKRIKTLRVTPKTGEVLINNCVNVPLTPVDDPNKPGKVGPGHDEPKNFTFDAVYDWDCRQRDVYDETAHPLIEQVLEGYNGTMFAYGQTGCGKSFTMMGVEEPPEMRGIIPNAFVHIFNHIAQNQGKEFLIRASFLEIYNEEIRDLLAKDPNQKQDLKEDPEKGVYVKDLTAVVVKDYNEVCAPQQRPGERAASQPASQPASYGAPTSPQSTPSTTAVCTGRASTTGLRWCRRPRARADR
jgi:hypothetical protein